MNRWSRSLLQITVAFTTMMLAGIGTGVVSVIFHSRSQLVIGIVFLVTFPVLLLFFEKRFPSVYPPRGPRPWWQNRGVFFVALAFVVSILSSRLATIWFGLLIVSGVLVFLFLRLARRDGEF